MRLNQSPSAFANMRAGDRYGGFHMVFSELEEEANGETYDPCYEFHNNRRASQVYATAMRQFSKYAVYHTAELGASAGTASAADPLCKTPKACKAMRRAKQREAVRARTALNRVFDR
jgi:hypothetical protein